MRALIITNNVLSVNVSPTAIKWSFSLLFPESVGSVHRASSDVTEQRYIYNRTNS